MAQATAAPITADTGLPDSPARYLPIPFAVLAVIGLGLWFSGGGDDGDLSTGGLIGAAVICASMLCLIGFAAWLGGSTRPLVRAGAAAFALAGLCHLVENLLVLALGRGGYAEGGGLWDATNALSYVAFTLLGVAALLVGLGLAGPGWLRGLGLLTGVLGLLSGLSAFLGALDVVVPIMNLCALAFLIAVGLRRGR